MADGATLPAVLKPAFRILEGLFQEFDRDGCGSVLFPQMLFELKQRGLKDPNALTTLWYSQIDKDRDNCVNFAEFLAIMYYWMRESGNYSKLLHDDSKATVVASAMETMVKAYLAYDTDRSGGISRAEVQRFLTEQSLPVSESTLTKFFGSSSEILFSNFMLLLYQSMGEGAFQNAAPTQPLKEVLELQATAKTPQLVTDLQAAFGTLEEDFKKRKTDNGYATLEVLVSNQEHQLITNPESKGHTCAGCKQVGCAYGCPYQGCSVWVCEACWQDGLKSHCTGFAKTGVKRSKHREAEMELITRYFNLVDLDQSGFLDFFEFVTLAFLCCKYLNYGTLCPESRNPALVKHVLTFIGAKYEQYDADNTHDLDYDEATRFWKDYFGPFPGQFKKVFDLFATNGILRLPSFFAFLSAFVNPTQDQKQAVATRTAKKPVLQPAAVMWMPQSVTHVSPHKRVEDVDPHKLRKIKKLGEGGQSIAYLVDYAGMELVGKYPRQELTIEDKGPMLAAAKLQKSIDHVNVLKVIGVCSTPPEFILIEFCGGGDMSDQYNKYPTAVLERQNPIPPGLQWRIARESAEAYNALHTSNPPIMHRDIKGANVFLDRELHVKIADFDMATSDATATEIGGTPGFMAPEVLKGGPYNYKCDVFSYGGLLYELTHNRYPYSKEVPYYPEMGDDAYFRILTGQVCSGIRPAITPNRASPGMELLMQACWNTNPADRPTMAQVITHLDSIKADYVK
eukprot:NODE_491_length_2418_cov_36.645752_g466_i0.p1 GENE.NODE_491_length_2418_cov_36.645752_g466_i0~~NODE_491_length_2418_cov_36.645752_g466_i0.p1  ORF type:complete len:755 (-),score=155.25 NODE_491_length_2418_cov_36.645752_g466_i0:154-2364(-)